MILKAFRPLKQTGSSLVLPIWFDITKQHGSTCSLGGLNLRRTGVFDTLMPEDTLTSASGI
jgi:hypothetical protein